MKADVFESAVRKSGDMAGAFEYDGDTAYFYLYYIDEFKGNKVLDAIRIFSGNSELSELDVAVKWDKSEDKVGVFLRRELWAFFEVSTGKKFGGDYSDGGRSLIEVNQNF